MKRISVEEVLGVALGVLAGTESPQSPNHPITQSPR